MRRFSLQTCSSLSFFLVESWLGNADIKTSNLQFNASLNCFSARMLASGTVPMALNWYILWTFANRRPQCIYEMKFWNTRLTLSALMVWWQCPQGWNNSSHVWIPSKRGENRMQNCMWQRNFSHTFPFEYCWEFECHPSPELQSQHWCLDRVRENVQS